MHITLSGGSFDTNSRGHIIEYFITNNCLCILNNGDDTNFYESSMTFLAIDLIMSSPIFFFLHFKFLVSNNLHSSDHFPLFLPFHDFNQEKKKS